MLEEIRVALMKRLFLKRQEMKKSSAKVCPRIQGKLEKEKALAAMCTPCPSSDTLFQVNHQMDSFVVDLENHTCTCRKWNMFGVPCCHAVACIFMCNREAEDFVADVHKRDIYLKAYANSIPRCTGEKHWPKCDLPLEPPPIKIGPSRPRLNRRKDPHENPKITGKLTKHGVEMTCSICQQKGHNKKGCPKKESPVQQEAPLKRPMGRPKKDGVVPPQRGFEQSSHFTATAEPTRTGRGGRIIRRGKGSTGAGRVVQSRGATSTSREGTGRSIQGGRGTTSISTSRGRGRGRGGSSRGRSGGGRSGTTIPTGAGVYFASGGVAYVNHSYGSRPRVVGEGSSVTTTYCPPQSQQSINAP